MPLSPAKHEERTVLVTGTGGRSVGGGILHALLRSSPDVRSRWRVVAADADPFAWGLYKADANVLLPYASSDDYIGEVKRIVDLHNIDAIIPGTETEIRPLLQNADALAPAVVVANRIELLPLMLDKFLAAEKLVKLGHQAIPTVPLPEWPMIASHYGFPLIVKPARNTGGSRGVHLVNDERELERLLPLLSQDTEQCVQPYVGDPDEEYTVGVLTDTSGNLIDSWPVCRF
jgi:carbamoyl-phosphate synthase large subunit